MRRHLRWEKKNIKDVAPIWQVTATTAYNLFYRKELPLRPQQVQAFVRWLKLDEFDAQELYILGARESGWPIDKTFLLKDD